MKSGWAYGTCHGCDNHGSVMVVANALKCEDCIAVETGKRGAPPLKRHECHKCKVFLGAWEAVLPWGFQAECPGCGWLTKVDDGGLIREINAPPTILCSSCGEVLQRDGDCFRCQCGRVVTA